MELEVISGSGEQWPWDGRVRIDGDGMVVMNDVGRGIRYQIDGSGRKGETAGRGREWMDDGSSNAGFVCEITGVA
jgi:hypothetical protein